MLPVGAACLRSSRSEETGFYKEPSKPKDATKPFKETGFHKETSKPKGASKPSRETGFHKETSKSKDVNKPPQGDRPSQGTGPDELYEETGFHKEPSKPKDVNKPLKPPDVTDDHKNTLGIADVCNGTQFWEDTNDHSYREKRKFALNKIFEAWLTWMIEEAEAASEESSDAETNRQ